jgi:hypothetical protein
MISVPQLDTLTSMVPNYNYVPQLDTLTSMTVILWLSVLLVVEIGVTVENNRPVVLVDVNQTTIRSQPRRSLVFQEYMTWCDLQLHMSYITEIQEAVVVLIIWWCDL